MHDPSAFLLPERDDVPPPSTLGYTLSDKHVPKHRHAPVKQDRSKQDRPPADQPRGRRLRVAALLSGVAVAATGLAVSGGVLAGSSPVDGAAAALSASAPTDHAAGALSADELADREQRASRSSEDRRPVADRAKAASLSNAAGRAVTRTQDLSDADPRTLAKALMPQVGMDAGEFGCLDNIWSQESGWNVHADNPTSSAYGIPQALPGSKMASAGPNWESNPETQIRWGLGYIKSRYGSACSAWSFKQGHGWY